MSTNTTYVGMDAHKKQIQVAMLMPNMGVTERSTIKRKEEANPRTPLLLSTFLREATVGVSSTFLNKAIGVASCHCVKLYKGNQMRNKIKIDRAQLQHAPTSHDICAIVVTYNPDKGFLERLYSIIQQVDKVVIVDNHPSETWMEGFRTSAVQLNIHLIANKKNLGIATALNQGVQYAIKCGYAWVLTLDQDSLVEPNLVENLTKAYRDCPFKEYIGIIGTNIKEKISGKVAIQEKDCRNRSWLEVNEVITSGSLIPTSVFNKVGPFRDDFFIDLVDFEYCLRLLTRGYRIIKTFEVGITQSFGTLKTKKVFGINKMVRDYNPLRSYYRTRNGLLLIREYFWKDILWSLRRLVALWLRVVSIVIFEENKMQKFKYTLIGIYHAFISKTGKIA